MRPQRHSKTPVRRRNAKIMQVINLIFMVIALILILRIIGVWGGGPYMVWGGR